ncbi:MAG: hypothetical protein F4Y35_02515 [Chloroflexi bacterium]|nr:hypothetical protein [Chloroflexota bacterium]
MNPVNHETRTQTTTRGRYVGPSAARIAELVAAQRRVRFERGWFWTEAVCHESGQDLLMFRQRPDGDGIDVRCRSAGCSRERIIRSLETATGEAVWSAYSSDASAAAPAGPAAITANTARGLDWRVIAAPFAIVLLAAPLVAGHDLQVAALNVFGLGWAGWLCRRFMLERLRAAVKGERRR